MYPFQVRWQTNLPNKSKLLIVTHNTEKLNNYISVCIFRKSPVVLGSVVRSFCDYVDSSQGLGLTC